MAVKLVQAIAVTAVSMHLVRVHQAVMHQAKMHQVRVHHSEAPTSAVAMAAIIGHRPIAERWDDQYVDVKSLRPKNKEEESQNSVAKNLDGELMLAQPKVVDTDSGLHQQHKQLQAPMQQQQQQPQTTPQQQEGELVDTTDGVTEHQHRAAQQLQGPNPVDMMGPSSPEEAHVTRATPLGADGNAPTIAPPKSDAATTAVVTTDRANMPSLNNLNVPISPSREDRVRAREGGHCTDQPTKRRKEERAAERAEATSKAEPNRKAFRSRFGGGLVSTGRLNGTQATSRAQAEPVAEPVAGVARIAGGDRNEGESGGLDDSEGQRRVKVTEPCAQDL